MLHGLPMSKKLKKIKKKFYFFYPGDINIKTGGYIYEKNIFNYAKKINFNIKYISVTSKYPHPSPKDLNDLLIIIYNLPLNSILIFDGLVMEGLLPIIESLKNYTIYTLIHHPLYLEVKGLESKSFLKKEKKIYKYTDSFFVTSKKTKELLNKKFNISNSIIKIIEPGIKKLKKYKKIIDSNVHLLSCGSIIERKNYFYLVQELKLIKNIKVHIVGDNSRENKYFKKITKFIDSNNLNDKIKFYGKVTNSKLEKLYSQLVNMKDLGCLWQMH